MEDSMHTLNMIKGTHRKMNATHLGNLALLGAGISFGTAVAATANGQDSVRLTQPDTSSAVGQNSFVLGTNWSDGEAPSEGKDYLVAFQGEGGIIASANYGALAFSGRSLTLGNAETGDAGWLFAYNLRPLTIGDLRCVVGGVRFSTGSNWSRVEGRAQVLSAVAAPFVFEASGTQNWQLDLDIVGAADRGLLFRVNDGEPASSDVMAFRTLTDSHAAFADYLGQLTVDGTNVLLSAEWNSTNLMPTNFLGQADAARADAVVLRRGGGLRVVSQHQFAFNAGGRGIRVGEGGGLIDWGKVERAFSASVTGPGVLSFGNRAGAASGATLHAMTLACGGLAVLSNATVRLAEDFAFGAGASLEVQEGGTLVTKVGGNAPQKTTLQGGAKIVLGVGFNERIVNNQSGVTLYRPGNGQVGTLALDADSQIVGASSEKPIQVGLELFNGQNRVSGSYGGRIPALTVPTAVRTVSADDFAFSEETESGSYRIEVETDGEIQTVFLVATRQVLVCPEGTAGNTPAAPYDTWETAANDVATAVSAATAGSVVRIRPGVYKTAATITVPTGVSVRGEDENGALAPDRVILDGGATADDRTAGHRVFLLSNAGSGLCGLTIRNGFAADQGGGAYITNPTAGLSDCIFTNCFALSADGNGGRGGAVSVKVIVSNRAPLFTRCRFVACQAGEGGAVALMAGASLSAFAADRSGACAFVDCAFEGNEAVRADGNANGGALSATLCSVWTENCRFTGNWTTSTGASTSGARRGAAVEAAKYSVFANCVFDGNGSGHRALLNGGNPVRVMGCVFRNNTSDSLVGDGNMAESLVESCVFTNNACTYAIYGSARWRNCLYADNAMALNLDGSVFENVTVVSNRCPGVYLNATAAFTLANCIVAYNQGGEISNSRGNGNFRWLKTITAETLPTYATLMNSCVLGASTLQFDDGTPFDLLGQDADGKSIDAKPRFVDPKRNDWRLKRRSPCRDTGKTLDWMTADATDLAGNPRVVGRGGKPLADDAAALPDMGCFECLENAELGLLFLVK